jgi:hypothetical protein
MEFMKHVSALSKDALKQLAPPKGLTGIPLAVVSVFKYGLIAFLGHEVIQASVRVLEIEHEHIWVYLLIQLLSAPVILFVLAVLFERRVQKISALVDAATASAITQIAGKLQEQLKEHKQD